MQMFANSDQINIGHLHQPVESNQITWFNVIHLNISDNQVYSLFKPMKQLLPNDQWEKFQQVETLTDD